MSGWTVAELPPLAGKFAIVTGANSGTGFFTACALASAGAQVVVACRNPARGAEAVAKIEKIAPGRASFGELDLASLASVRKFAAGIKAEHGVLDILVNNAGVMGLKKRQTTADGFEMQLGVNFLGHFALTALLLPLLVKAPAPRVVQVSSIAHRRGQIDLADLQATKKYRPMQVYSQSKLAMLMFAFELQRRSDAGGWGLLSVAAHPGIARTALVANGMGAISPAGLMMKLAGPFVTHSGAAGAAPIIYAAAAKNIVPAGYYGPTGFQEFRGPPGVAIAKPQALHRGVARGLWEAAEALTGETFISAP